jgi:hypothetical protein
VFDCPDDQVDIVIGHFGPERKPDQALAAGRRYGEIA